MEQMTNDTPYWKERLSAHDTISRQAAIDALGEKPLAWTEGEYELGLQQQWEVDVDAIKAVPSAQHEPISEEYAKAVRTWLINYQVRCAELMGRYTPYEILGWIVSDWRKENEIW